MLLKTTRGTFDTSTGLGRDGLDAAVLQELVDYLGRTEVAARLGCSSAGGKRAVSAALLREVTAGRAVTSGRGAWTRYKRR